MTSSTGLAGRFLITSDVIGFALAAAQKGHVQTTRRQDMTDLNKIAENYIAAWNETDAARRGPLLEAAFTKDIRYRDPLMQGEGHDGMAALIDGVHQRFAGFRFSLKGKPDGFANYIRFSWALGPQGTESIVEGTDVGIIEDGRLNAIAGFLDKVPA
jgi:SnoaL-like protein